MGEAAAGNDRTQLRSGEIKRRRYVARSTCAFALWNDRGAPSLKRLIRCLVLNFIAGHGKLVVAIAPDHLPSSGEQLNHHLQRHLPRPSLSRWVVVPKSSVCSRGWLPGMGQAGRRKLGLRQKCASSWEPA